MSMIVPGIAVAVTTMACSFSKPLTSLWFVIRVEVSTALSALAAILTEIAIVQHGKIAANGSRVTGKPSPSILC
jgi:hypothetical protein